MTTKLPIGFWAVEVGMLHDLNMALDKVYQANARYRLAEQISYMKKHYGGSYTSRDRICHVLSGWHVAMDADNDAAAMITDLRPGFWSEALATMRTVNVLLEGKPRQRKFLARQIVSMRRSCASIILTRERITGALLGWYGSFTSSINPEEV